MSDNLYTFVCDYRGGTYISQVCASDEVEAVRRWAELLEVEKPAPRVSKYLAAAALRDLDHGGRPGPLTGLVNVWCISAVVGGDMMLTNFVLSRAGPS